MTKLVLNITCGEKTCASEPGKFCEYVRSKKFGTRWDCYLFGELGNSKDDGTGWLLRHEDCLAAEDKR